MITKKCCKCGTDIHKDAKQCPNCFAKQKMPIPKWIFIVIAVLLIGVIANISSKDDSNSEQSNVASNEVSDKAEIEQTAEPTETPIPYEKITVKELAKVLDDNALNAKNTYLDKYLEVTGVIVNIDASGDYISLDESEDKINFVFPIQCYIQDDSQAEKIAKMKKGDKVTLKVKITDVGEIIKYQADIIEVE